MVTHLVYFRRGTWETVEDRTEVGAALRRSAHLRPLEESLYCYNARPVFAAGGDVDTFWLFFFSLCQFCNSSLQVSQPNGNIAADRENLHDRLTWEFSQLCSTSGQWVEEARGSSGTILDSVDQGKRVTEYTFILKEKKDSKTEGQKEGKRV